MEISSIDPNRDDVTQILKIASEYANNLYPAESNHLDDESELSKTNVYFIGLFESETLIGIGAVKMLVADCSYGEIKRVFVSDQHRGKGASKIIMNALENHLLDNGVHIARLETGIYQPEAIGLYKKLGYIQRLPFADYQPDPLSIFMEKQLKK